MKIWIRKRWFCACRPRRQQGIEGKMWATWVSHLFWFFLSLIGSLGSRSGPAVLFACLSEAFCFNLFGWNLPFGVPPGSSFLFPSSGGLQLLVVSLQRASILLLSFVVRRPRRWSFRTAGTLSGLTGAESACLKHIVKIPIFPNIDGGEQSLQDHCQNYSVSFYEIYIFRNTDPSTVNQRPNPTDPAKGHGFIGQEISSLCKDSIWPKASPSDKDAIRLRKQNVIHGAQKGIKC